MTSWDPLMSRYCKGYKVDDLKAFPGFPDGPFLDEEGNERDICYVHEDFLVTTGVLRRDEEVIFRGDADGWETFCTEQLGFEGIAALGLDPEPPAQSETSDGVSPPS